MSSIFDKKKFTNILPYHLISWWKKYDKNSIKKHYHKADGGIMTEELFKIANKSSKQETVGISKYPGPFSCSGIVIWEGCFREHWPHRGTTQIHHW